MERQLPPTASKERLPDWSALPELPLGCISQREIREKSSVMSVIREKSSPDWSGLPEPALLSIAMSLTGNLADVHAFGGVCRGWRSVASDNERDIMSSLPPLLFRERWAGLYCTANGRVYKNRRLSELLVEDWKDFRTIGCSFGHVIVAHSVGHIQTAEAFSVVNPLTLTRTHVGEVPPHLRSSFGGWAATSSPPTSSDCILWFRGDDRGRIYRLADQNCTAISKSSERSYSQPPVFLGDKGYLIDNVGNLAAFEINPPCSLTVVPVAGASPPLIDPRLCVSGAELLLVGVTRREVTNRVTEIGVYRYDFSVADWVRLRSLGGRALLVDSFTAIVSENPSRWGGRGDCIYFAYAGGRVLGVFHLKDGKVEHLPPLTLPEPAHFYHHIFMVWILPSMCY